MQMGPLNSCKWVSADGFRKELEETGRETVSFKLWCRYRNLVAQTKFDETNYKMM